MTRPSMDCARIEPLLSELADAGLEKSSAEMVQAHVAGCDSCSRILADLVEIRNRARALPSLTPDGDLWPRIEERIQTPVIEMQGPARYMTGAAGPEAGESELLRRYTRRFAVVAAALVVLSVGITSITMRTLRRVPQQTAGSAVSLPTQALPDVGGSGRFQEVVQTYEPQIATLRGLFESRRSTLDSNAVLVVERNLAIIDAAIRETLAALQQDSASLLTEEQLHRALGAKVSLLRTAVMLPATSE